MAHFRSAAVVFIGVTVAVLVSAKSFEPASPFADAQFARRVPMIAGATLEKVDGDQFYQEPAGPLLYFGRIWSFSVTEPVGAVRAYYRERLGAEPVEADDGSLLWRWTPPDAGEGEAVGVSVRPGEILILEVVKAVGRA